MKPDYVDHKELCRRALFSCDSTEDYGYTPSSSLPNQTLKVSLFLLIFMSFMDRNGHVVSDISQNWLKSSQGVVNGKATLVLVVGLVNLRVV